MQSMYDALLGCDQLRHPHIDFRRPQLHPFGAVWLVGDAQFVAQVYIQHLLYVRQGGQEDDVGRAVSHLAEVRPVELGLHVTMPQAVLANEECLFDFSVRHDVKGASDCRSITNYPLRLALRIGRWIVRLGHRLMSRLCRRTIV